MANAVKGSLKICVHNLAEIFLAHCHQKPVFGDSCIVYQDIDPSICFHDFFDKSTAGIKVCHIALADFCLSAVRLDFSFYRLCFFFGTVIINDYKCSLSGKLKGNCPSNSTGSACHNCDFFLCIHVFFLLLYVSSHIKMFGQKDHFALLFSCFICCLKSLRSDLNLPLSECYKFSHPVRFFS